MTSKPHICKMPGFGKVWYAFRDRSQRDLARDEIARAVHDNNRRHDAVTWGLTFEHALKRYLGTFA